MSDIAESMSRRIVELECECAALKERLETCTLERDIARQMAKEDSARLAETERDAERYRWLRADMARVDPVMSVVCKVHRDRRSSEWCNIHDLDKTIDAARAADSTLTMAEAVKGSQAGAPIPAALAGEKP